MQNEPWVWPEVGMPGRAAWEQCLEAGTNDGTATTTKEEKKKKKRSMKTGVVLRQAFIYMKT